MIDCFLKGTLPVMCKCFNNWKWPQLFAKASFADCTMATDHWSPYFQKHKQIYSIALYSLKTGWISIFVCHAVKSFSK